MLTYTALAAAVIFVLFRWLRFRQGTRTPETREEIDTRLLQQLNREERHEG